jgi:hypothetical protein
MLALSDVEEKRPAFDLAEHFWLSRPLFSDDFAQEVMERFDRHAKQWESLPIANAIFQAYRTYHGLSSQLGDSPTVNLMEAGEEGEFLALSINHFRGLVRHQIALVTADRPTWDPQARTGDADASKQVSLTRNILDYAMSAKRFDQILYNQMELAKVCASGFQALGWDASLNGGKGDVWACELAPWEVAHEKVRRYSDCQYWIFRRFESRWDWAAHYADSDPEKAEQIAQLSSDTSMFCGVRYGQDAQDDDRDRIPVLYVYANATKACPGGRLAIVAAGNLVLLDGPNPYGAESPIVRMCPAEFLATSTPIADSWALLAPQEAYTATVSAIMSRVDIGAVPNIAVQDGTEVDPSTLSGANHFNLPPGANPPTLIDLLSVPSALPAFAKEMKGSMEELSGINSVTRGNPTENITSGSMAALLQSMAIQFNSADERAYTFNLEAIGTHLIRIYQRMATEAQIISIAGDDQQWTAREFKAEDLDQILRIAVRTASALGKTLAGRKEIADQLLQQGVIQHPAEYLEVVQTGNLSPIFKGPVDELVTIKSENERIRRGEPVFVLQTDNHSLHIREHRCELNGDGRYDPKISGPLQQHIMEHYETWQQTSMEAPDVCVAVGFEPLPGALATGQAAAAAQQMPGAPPQNSPPAQKTPNAVDTKAQPGPKPAPPGKEQSQAAPSLPQPAQPPAGAA